MKTNSTYFDSFQSFCQGSLDKTGYEIYCEPVRKNVEKGAKWLEDAAQPICTNAKWSWKKTGEHYGETGQLVMVLLIAGIAYNIFGGKKEKDKEKTPPPTTQKCNCPHQQRVRPRYPNL